MPTPTKGPRLGGSPAHQRIILANLASQLFEHGKITTTEAKARRLRPLAEKLITKAKRGDIHARRSVLTIVRDKSVVHTLFTEIAPTFDGRDGGYLRITKVGPRKGDNAPMAVIELVTEPVGSSRTARNQSTAGRPTPARPPATTAAQPVEVAPTIESPEQVSPDEAAPAQLPGESLVAEGADDQLTPSEAVPSDDTDAEDGAGSAVPTAPVEETGPDETRG